MNSFRAIQQTGSACYYAMKRKTTAESNLIRQKRSKNHGEWDTMLAAQQERYLSDIPSPDPIFRALELQNALRSTVSSLLTCNLSPIRVPNTEPVPILPSPDRNNAEPKQKPQAEEAQDKSGV